MEVLKRRNPQSSQLLQDSVIKDNNWEPLDIVTETVYLKPMSLQVSKMMTMTTTMILRFVNIFPQVANW